MELVIVNMLGMPLFFRELMTVTRFGVLPVDVVLIVISFAMKWRLAYKKRSRDPRNTELYSTFLGKIYGIRLTTDKYINISLVRDDAIVMELQYISTTIYFIVGDSVEETDPNNGCVSYYRDSSTIRLPPDRLILHTDGRWELIDAGHNVIRNVTRYAGRVISIATTEGNSYYKYRYIEKIYLRDELVSYYTMITNMNFAKWYFRQGKVYFSAVGYADGMYVATTYDDGNIIEQTIRYRKKSRVAHQGRASGVALTHVDRMIRSAGVERITTKSVVGKLRDGTSFC